MALRHGVDSGDGQGDSPKKPHTLAVVQDPDGVARARNINYNNHYLRVLYALEYSSKTS
jgi:hypothetical protein